MAREVRTSSAPSSVWLLLDERFYRGNPRLGTHHRAAAAPLGENELHIQPIAGT